jgi:hypothetical protein
MFKYVRVQILYPCRAQCAWCSTHRKNPLFRRLYDSGVAETVHRFYIEVIRDLRPEQVFVSGGEPLLYPGIAAFLNAIAHATEQINLFTSYQYGPKACDQIPFERMPLEKTVLTHTSIGFAPDRWHELTAGFPFERYVENIRAVAHVPARKRIKFMLNHPDLEGEIARFQKCVAPDHTFELGLKVVNEQGGALNRESIEQSRALVQSRALALEQLVAGAGWGGANFMPGSLETMAPLLVDGDPERCLYRRKPLELRFALYKADLEDQVLKYRYCPYFPSDFGHRFHIGRDDPHRLRVNYRRGDFRDHCLRCRFLTHYGS